MNGLLLINAPYPRRLRFYGQPTSLLYAASLACDGITTQSSPPHVALLNYNLLSVEEQKNHLIDHLKASVVSFRPAVVGISTTTASLRVAYEIAAAVKQVHEQALVIIGGPHDDDTHHPSALANPNCDVSVSGDGESPLSLLVQDSLAWNRSSHAERRRRLEQKSLETRLYGRFRITFRDGGTLMQNHHGAPPLALDDLPVMPRSLLHPAERFHYPVFKHPDGTLKATAQIMTQRGCVAKCPFCSESQMLQRRSLSSVVSELHTIKQQGYEAVFFDDSTFTSLNESRRDFIAQLGTYLVDLGLEWGCQTRVDMIDERIAKCLAEAGCTYVFTGIESLSPRILTALGKHYSVEQICRAMDILGESGIRVGASILLGAHDEQHRTVETTDSALKTFAGIRRYVDRGIIIMTTLNLLGYYPGTLSTVGFEESGQAAEDESAWISSPHDDEYPFSLLEENPARCPIGAREIARQVLPFAAEILGHTLAGAEPNPHQNLVTIDSL